MDEFLALTKEAHKLENKIQSLITVWNAANRICSKRLAPFWADLINSMERHDPTERNLGKRKMVGTTTFNKTSTP